MSRYKQTTEPVEHTTGVRMIEINPGVWIDYLEWETAQKREKRFWEGRVIPEDERIACLRKIEDMWARHPEIGRRDSL